MPQTTPERSARWPGMDRQATNYLKDKGYRLTSTFRWESPTDDYEVTEEEEDAMIYLIEEWDYGGIV